MSTAITLVGVITDIFQVEQITDRFKKRIFWLKQPDTERYPEHWQIECTQDATSLLDQCKIGELVQVSINIRGKKYSKNGKDSVFNSLVCWQIAKYQASGTGSNGGGNGSELTEPLDDLPF